MDIFQNLVGSVFIAYAILLVSVIFVYAFQICLMLAIGFDCRAKGIKRRAMWMVLSLLFPIPVAIIYACVRKGEERENYKKCNACGAVLDDRVSYCAGCGSNEFTPCDPEKKQKYSQNSKTCLIVSIVSYVVSLLCILGFVFGAASMVGNTLDGAVDGIKGSIIGGVDNLYDDFDYDYDDSYHYGYEVNGETVYYDREGKPYTDDLAVVYYDKQNNTYSFDDEYYEFKGSNGKNYMSSYCYVDANGYLYFDAAGYENESKSAVYYSAKSDSYVDKDGNIYYQALDVSWDKDGKLVDAYDGEYLLDEVTPTDGDKEN